MLPSARGVVTGSVYKSVFPINTTPHLQDNIGQVGLEVFYYLLNTKSAGLLTNITAQLSTMFF